MRKILKHVQAHYESTEVPFGKSYEWHPAHVALECDCGEKLILSATSTMTACRGCGAEYGAVVQRIREEDHLPNAEAQPWIYDLKERATQHKRDEAAYPEGSPWRYNDITAYQEE
jgi:hypothetical protein